MLDLYAMPITFRYKNQKKFYTNYGALTSLILILLIFGYLGLCFHQMMAYSTYTTQTLSQSITNRPDLYGPPVTDFQSYWPQF